MDLNTMLKKLKSFAYSNKAEFQADLDLIFDNCYFYNTSEDSPYRANVRELRERWVVLLRTIPEQITENGISDDTAIMSDAEYEMPMEEFFIPARHPKRMAKRYLYPEFEAFCNSLPDPRYYKFKVPRLRTWTPHPSIAANIKHIRSIRQRSPDTMSNEEDNGIWQIPRILTEKLARVVTDRVFAMVAADASAKTVSKSAVAVWRDALKVYIVDLILKPLKSLIDEHSHFLGLEVHIYSLGILRKCLL